MPAILHHPARVAATLVAVVFLAGLSRPCDGRLSKLWRVDDLLKSADLVVIARAEKSEPTADKMGSAPWEAPMIGVDTTFEVKAVMKGTIEGTLKMLHYAYPPEVVSLRSGPNLASFDTGERAPAYLLFLKKREDGRYEPVSGQMDPT